MALMALLARVARSTIYYGRWPMPTTQRCGWREVLTQATQRGPGKPRHRQASSSTPPTESSSSRVIPASMAIRAPRLPSSVLSSYTLGAPGSKSGVPPSTCGRGDCAPYSQRRRIMSRPMWVSAVSDTITFPLRGLIDSGLAAKDLAGFFSVFDVVKCLQFLNLLFCHVRMPPATAKVAEITEEH
jgi:hypothetical protein